jgi:hypothetical protein
VSNDNFFSEFDDVMEESESSLLASAFWAVIRIGVFVLSAVTTFAFFAIYVGNAFEFLVGSELSPYISGMAGVFVLDFAALAWSQIRAKHAKTNGQMSVSRFTGLGDLIASVTVTALFLALHAGFDVGIYLSDGVTLSSLGQVMHYLGMFIIIAAVSGNFVAGYMYANASPEVLLAVQTAKITAGRRAAAFAAERARIQLTTQHEMEEIKRQLPALAKSDGRESGREYLGRTTKQGSRIKKADERLRESATAFEEAPTWEELTRQEGVNVGPGSNNHMASVDVFEEEPEFPAFTRSDTQRPRSG